MALQPWSLLSLRRHLAEAGPRSSKFKATSCAFLHSLIVPGFPRKRVGGAPEKSFLV